MNLIKIILYILIIKDIIDNDEYNKIKAEINSILLTMKNESDKIDNIDIN